MSLQQSVNSQQTMKTKLVDEISENLDQMLVRLKSGETLAVRLDQDLEGLKSCSNTNLLNEDGKVIRNSGSMLARLTMDLKDDFLRDKTHPHTVRSEELVEELYQVIKVLGRVANDVSKFIPGTYRKSVNANLSLLENIFEGVLKVALSTSTTLKKLEKKEQQQKDDRLKEDSGMDSKRRRTDLLEKRDKNHDKKMDEPTDTNKSAEESLKRSNGRHSNKNADDDHKEPNEDKALDAKAKGKANQPTKRQRQQEEEERRADEEGPSNSNKRACRMNIERDTSPEL